MEKIDIFNLFEFGEYEKLGEELDKNNGLALSKDASTQELLIQRICTKKENLEQRILLFQKLIGFQNAKMQLTSKSIGGNSVVKKKKKNLKKI